MPHIQIQQLDANGNVWRTFDQWPTRSEVAGRLHRITYAYNLERTRVSVDGHVIELQRESAAQREP